MSIRSPYLHDVGKKYKFQDRRSPELVIGRSHGAFGAVYIVEGQEKERPPVTALKTLRADILKTSEGIKEFDREALLWRGLPSHAGIVNLETVFRLNHAPYIRMEYAPQGSLLELIKKRQIAANEIAKIFGNVFGALSYLEAADVGFSHGDIKPSNILLDRRGTGKLSDFGLMRTFNYVSVNKRVAGDTSFLPPEVTKGAEEPSKLSDIFALGRTLLLSVAGPLLTLSESYGLVVTNDSNSTHQELEVIRSMVPKSLFDLISSCLRTSPLERPQTFSEIEGILHNSLGRTLQQVQTQKQEDQRVEPEPVQEDEHPEEASQNDQKLSANIGPVEYARALAGSEEDLLEFFIKVQRSESDQEDPKARKALEAIIADARRRQLKYKESSSPPPDEDWIKRLSGINPSFRYLVEIEGEDPLVAKRFIHILWEALEYRNMNRFETSEMLLMRLVMQRPGFPPVLADLGHLESMQRRHKDAYKWLKIAISRYEQIPILMKMDNFGYSMACNNYTQECCFMRPHMTYLSEAIPFARKSCKLTPEHPKSWLALGMVLWRSEVKEEAVEVLEKAHRMDPLSTAIKANIVIAKFLAKAEDWRDLDLLRDVGIEYALTEADVVGLSQFLHGFRQEMIDDLLQVEVEK